MFLRGVRAGNRWHHLVSFFLVASTTTTHQPLVSAFFTRNPLRSTFVRNAIIGSTFTSRQTALHNSATNTSDPSAQSSTPSTLTASSTTMDRDDALKLPALSTTAKRLFLVRHGEVINPGGDNKIVYYGGMDVPLSPLGELEAQAAAKYLQQFEIQQIFSSPLSRAKYGAEQVKLHQQPSFDGEIVVLDGFTELNRGDWCGLTKEEIGAELLKRFDACDESVTPGGGGESYPALKRRVLEARDQALQLMRPGTCGCLVSHLQVTRSILSEALNIPTNEMVQLKVATASVTCIDYDGTTQTVQFQSYKPNVGLRPSKDGAN